jgi:hypothetical protein
MTRIENKRPRRVPARTIGTRGQSDRTHSLKTLRREPETKLVELAKLKVGDFEPDPTFRTFWDRAVSGATLVAFTRWPIEEIQRGFSKSTPDGMIAVDVPPLANDAELVVSMAEDIRSGHRPALHLYPGGHEKGCTHVCSDDTYALRAYASVGIRLVPVMLLDFSTKTLKHPALVYRHVDSEADFGEACIFVEEVVADDHPGVPAFAQGKVDAVHATAHLDKISTALATTLAALRSFHLPGGDVHYHQTLGSVLVRAIRLLAAIRPLLLPQPEQAAVLVRSLYELSLNLHLDWLAPQEVGPMFLMHGRDKKSDVISATRLVEQERVAEGWNPAAAADSMKAVRNMFDLVQKAERKGALHPLGPHHRDLYGFLSHQSHQDFVAGENFLNVLSQDVDPMRMKYPHMEEDISTLIRIADHSAATIVSCIGTDVAVVFSSL